MKATALIAVAALVCGTAAFAQQSTDRTARGEENARVDQQDHGQANAKMRDGMHRLGDKTRHAFHRAGNKIRQVAHNDHRSSDTRAMGASGDEHGRQGRMDDAYGHWQNRQDRDQHR